MNIKLILSLIVFAFVGILTLSQVGVVNASTNFSNHLISGPITSFHTLGGKITYRFIQRGVVTTGIINIVPAANVTVNATNKTTNETYSTQTDSDGTYSFNLSEGTYQINSSDNQNTKFSPSNPTKVLNKDRLNTNFQGTIFIN